LTALIRDPEEELMRYLVSLTLAALALTAPALAEDAPVPTWKGSLGLSYVATSGNSDTKTLGLDFGLDRKPEPWGLEIRALALRADQNGDTTAERYGASFKGKRALGDRWEVFAGLGADKDKFAGYDLRTLLAGGGTYKALLGPQHLLSFDAGLTWTREDLVALQTDAGEVDQPTNDYMGGLLGLNYTWQIAKTSKLTERLVWLPNFDVTSDWRVVSETAVQAAISSRLALKLGYLVRYDNEPAQSAVDLAGQSVYFDDTDTTTTISVVLTF
jgi:putative salt-induced outer membrane protein